MAASSSSSSSADTRTLEQLHKENAELQREIAALRASLGIDAKEEAAERARVLAVFNKYDADRSGTIDRKEFDAVAYDAGYDPTGLDEKGVSKIFEAIKPASPTAVTFEEFYKWFKSTATDSTKSKSYQLGLAVRLQAKSWNKSIESTRGALRSAKAKMGAAAAPRREIKSDFKDAREGVRVKVQVGEFREVGLGIAFHIKTDPDAAAALRASLAVPEGKTAFGFVDFAVATGADEAQLGELAGIMETILGQLGAGLNEKAGIPVYHSSSVTATKDKDGASVLRAAFFADINPVEMAAAATGQEAGTFSPSGLLDLRVALESPLALSLLRDPEFVLSPERIRARFTVDGSISSTIDARVQAVTTAVGLPAPKAAAAAAFASFFKGLNIDVQTIGLDAFAAKFAGSDRGMGKKIQKAAGMASAMPLFGLLQSFAVNARAQATAAAGAEMGPILNMFLRNIAGPKCAHAQIENTEVCIDFTGLDIIALLHALAPAA